MCANKTVVECAKLRLLVTPASTRPTNGADTIYRPLQRMFKHDSLSRTLIFPPSKSTTLLRRLAIRLQILLFYRQCETHYVEVIKGSKSDGKSLKSLCGYKSTMERVTVDHGKHLTVEFV